MLGAPDLDAGLQVVSHESGVKGQNLLPRPAGHAALDAAQGMVGFLGCKRTLLAHVEHEEACRNEWEEPKKRS